MTLTAGKLSISFGYLPAACLCICAVIFGERFAAALLCTVLHEAGHIFFLLKYGGAPIEIRLHCMGADIIDRKRNERSNFHQTVISLAGPAVNLICVPLFWAFSSIPFFHECEMISAALGLFNLIPAASTDGGTIAELLLHRFFSDKTASVIFYILSLTLLLPLCAASFFILLRSKNNFTMLLAVISVAASILRE